ncbi:MAG: peptidase C45 acyl-coenzyme A:6-aminopenicillanic acid acyl-transferase, partial [Candidatus Bathyarchaeota archaeon B23]
MNIHYLSGSYREIGGEEGSFIKGKFHPPPISDEKIDFTSKCLQYYERYTPGIIEEIEELSKEANLPPLLMESFLLTLGLEPRCTVFALSSERTIHGLPLFARNYDWDAEFQRFFTVFRTEPEGGLVHLSFSDHPVGRYGGVNEAGLAAAITAIPAYRGRPSPGIRMNIAVRWILDNFKTTEEACEWLLEIPHQWAHNFLVADRYGTLARVETSPERSVVYYSEEFVVTTNHYHDEEMRRLEDPEHDFTDTYRRYRIVEEWYRERGEGIGVE